jgi:hypothetical protein
MATDQSDISNFVPLAHALNGCFEMSLQELPEELRSRVKHELYTLQWDSLSPDQRRSFALQWDNQNNPAIEGDSSVGGIIG